MLLVLLLVILLPCAEVVWAAARMCALVLLWLLTTLHLHSARQQSEQFTSVQLLASL
jgi:hypothetical protein